MIEPQNQTGLMNRKNLFWIAAFSMLLIVICFFHVKDLNGPVVLNDEFGYWSIAASIAGKDWRDFIEITPYYNYGYSLLLIPLFYINLPFYIIYKISIIMNIGMLVFSFWLCMYCTKKMFSWIKIHQSALISFLVCAYPSTILQTQIAWTETLLYLLFWISVSLLVSLLEKYSLWKSVIFAISLGYMFMVHQRTIGILVSGIFTLLLYAYKRKKTRKRDIIIFFIVVFLIIGLHFIIKTDIKNWLWNNSTTSYMNDFSAQVSRIDKYFSLNALKNIFFGIGGRTFYFLVTGGLIFFYGMYYLAKKIVRIMEKNIDTNIPFIGVYVLCSFILLLLIGCVSIVEGFERVDTVVYARYLENVVGPILLCGFIKILENKIKVQYLITFAVLLVITATTTWYISSLITNPSFVDVCSVGLAQFYNASNKRKFISDATICALILNSLIFIIRKLKLKEWKFLLLGGIVALFWINTANYTYKNTIEKYQNSKTENNEWLANLILEEGVREVYYIKDQNFDPYATNVKYLQFWIPDVKIKVINKNVLADLKNCIWLCDKQSEFADENIGDGIILGESSEFYLCTRK